MKQLAAAASASTADQRAGYAVIWTTTPWTLPANQAVSVHPEFNYELVSTAKGVLILADDLADACLKRYGLERRALSQPSKGAALEHLKLQHPFYDRNVPVILGDHVTLDAGTGLVHTAPAHGVEDYVVGSHYKLPVENPVGDDGKFYRQDPAVRRPVRLEGQRCRDRDAEAKRPAAASRKVPAQLSALLAPQDADHLPRHHASGSSAWTSQMEGRRRQDERNPARHREERGRGHRILPVLGSGPARRR